MTQPSNARMKIEGRFYEASNVGTFPNGTTWMVRWYTHVTGWDEANDFKEAEITVQSDAPEVAIRAAIARESWA